MSTWKSVEWTCDRCNKREVLSARDDVGWASLYEVVPPLMSPLESDSRPDQICRDCRDSYHDWFLTGRTK